MDELANTVTYLMMAKDCAVLVGLYWHFISEIDHLIATAKANRTDTSDTISATVADAHQGRAVIGFTERTPGAGLIGKHETKGKDEQ